MLEIFHVMKQAPEVFITQAVFIPLSYPPKPYAKTLLLKTPYTLAVRDENQSQTFPAG